ncbi:HK97 family phage prohead protease [Rhizobium laguerreae]|uniref:HK97 family phage prohead protease n=1 Tax=Rhizobium laguerreae TaxID=1076926 RepID=UPI001C916998|nr:HK97 family phage prohead protease [Rhizobium laguerreae]MBY3255572.1 HK97 family phage prohead protease [Rhizobium laguerreae]MBY3282611.1 HK97 family phage prohead protease [Rhizobium laguerreae]MBY3288965.1 HK97 family phage prohead protease [Rhizobium laguerreae]
MTTTNIEKRSYVGAVEHRADDGKRTLIGYAAKFERLAMIGSYFQEKIAPGAFATAIGGDIRALVDHDPGRVIGRTKSGTLRLSEDGTGLRAEIDIPDTSDGNDLWVLVERGDISGMSFGFRVTKETWDETGDVPVRTIQAVELFEVSAVAWPAYEDTTIGLRSLDAARADGDLASRNATAAARRVAEKRAAMEQRIRGIRQDAS